MSELADAVLAAEHRMGVLIEESSLGTTGARQLRRRVSPETANRVVAHAEAAPVPDDTADATVYLRLKSATFHEVVTAAMTRDSEAVAALFTWIRPAIVRYCRARIGRTGFVYSTADDVAQEVCLAVLAALPRYSDNPESFLPFVYGIAAHKVADHYRRAARNQAELAADVPDGIDPQAGPEQLMMDTELRNRLNDLLHTLAPRQREILQLRLVVGLSVQEIAHQVGLAPTAVRVIQHRALAKLRGAISPSDWL